MFLLRMDVPHPKAVDGNVWECVVLTSDPFPSGAWYERAMLLEAATDAPADALEVLNTVFASDEELEQEFAPSRVWDEPPVLSGYRRLGYDVADFGGTSGLSNCGFQKDEVALLRLRYAKAINAHGLFERFEDADSYRENCDSRVEEHAPFYVYGVYVRPLK